MNVVMKLKVKVLASGSKGNATVIVTDSTCILIDIGISYLHLVKCLAEIGLSPSDIQVLLITHTHSDHVKGLRTFYKKTGVKAYVPGAMKKELLTIIDEEAMEFIDDFEKFGDVEVEVIHTSHDTSCSVGFMLRNFSCSLLYITDTGYIHEKYLKQMHNLDVYILESNHDEKMLMEGPYPFSIKQRILSDIGHLSNKTAAKYLSTMVGEKTKYVVLAHLSENNNTEELAYEATKSRLTEISYSGNLMIARQDEGAELIEV